MMEYLAEDEEFDRQQAARDEVRKAKQELIQSFGTSIVLTIIVMILFLVLMFGPK